MVYVRIELWPMGDRNKAKLIQEMSIANVGGDAEKGEYKVAVSHATTYKGSGFADPVRPEKSEIWKQGSCFHRRQDSPFTLVAKALAALGVK